MSVQEGDPRHCSLCAARVGPRLPEIETPNVDEERAKIERLKQAPAVASKKIPAKEAL